LFGESYHEYHDYSKIIASTPTLGSGYFFFYKQKLLRQLKSNY